MYIYICVSTFVYIYICVYLHLCISTFVYIYICVYLHLCISTFVYIYICVYLHLCISTFVYIYICVYLHLCISTFVYIYTCVYLLLSFLYLKVVKFVDMSSRSSWCLFAYHQACLPLLLIRGCINMSWLTFVYFFIVYKKQSYTI